MSPPLMAENGLACSAECAMPTANESTQPLVRYMHTTVPHQCMQFCTTMPQNQIPIGYNGIPQIYLQNCPFPFDDLHRIHPFRN